SQSQYQFMEVGTRMVADRPVVISSRSACCMSRTIQDSDKWFGANPMVCELDDIQNVQQVERELPKMGASPAFHLYS
ncbi:hypothetical protein V6N11_082505, partial [Hibiscus sabdariffa]